MECPSLTTVALATVYVALGSSRIILIRMSANEDHKYDYLPVTVNVCAEAVKLLVCLVLTARLEMQGKKTFHNLIDLSWPECLKFFQWSVPGLLYFLDNLIGFYVMTFFEPAVAVLLGNFVIISTSLLFRLILKRKFTRVQWASLVILFLAIVSLSNQDHKTALQNHHSATSLESIDNSTLGFIDFSLAVDRIPADLCHRKPRHTDDPVTVVKEEHTFEIGIGHVLIIVQCFISALANIYNEKIFKEGNNFQESIYIQNIRLYSFGVLFNTLTLFINSNYRNRIIYCGMFSGYNIYATLLIFDTAMVGLTISLILKHRDNMFHILCAQVTTVTIISLSILLTGFQPTLDFFLQMPTVFLAIFIYNISRSTDPQESARSVSPNASRKKKKNTNRSSSVSEEMIELTRADDEESDTEELS